jgi:hypothetical protein
MTTGAHDHPARSTLPQPTPARRDPSLGLTFRTPYSWIQLM